MNPSELFIFDLDGTLIEFHRDYLIQQALSISPKLGYPSVTEPILIEAFENFDFFRYVEKSIRDKFTEDFWQEFDWNNFPTPVPFSETKSVLQQIKDSGKIIAIATSRLSTREELVCLLEHTSILENITHVNTRTSEEIHWTDKRQLILEICKQVNIPPKNATMVGDIPTDITSAKDVGIGQTVAVKSGGLLESVLQKAEPDFLLDGIHQIPSLLQKM